MAVVSINNNIQTWQQVQQQAEEMGREGEKDKTQRLLTGEEKVTETEVLPGKSNQMVLSEPYTSFSTPSFSSASAPDTAYLHAPVDVAVIATILLLWVSTCIFPVKPHASLSSLCLYICVRLSWVCDITERYG